MNFPIFVGPSYPSESVLADAERTINWYPELMESDGAKSRVTLYPTPGRASFLTLSDFPTRGMFQQDTYFSGTPAAKAWVVAGSTIFAFNPAASIATVTTVINDGNPATFASTGASGTQLMILSGGTATIYNLSSGAIDGTVALSAQTCGMLSSRFLALDAATGTLKMSDPLDGLTWSAGNFVKRSAAGDPWQALAVAHGLIFLLGAKTGEIWYDAQLNPQPFAQVPNSLFQAGIAAKFSLVEVANGLTWLGANASGQAIVWREQGLVPGRISNHAVERAIQGYSKIDDAVASSYQEQGHTFYVLNFPTAGATWVWDQTTNVWHEEGFWNTNTMAYESNRCYTSAFMGGVHYVGDRVTGDIYTQSVDLATDVGGSAIRRRRVSPVLSDENLFLFHKQLVIDIQPGLGTATGQGQNPQAMLRWSNDAGQTWSNEHWASAGAQGQFGQRIRWQRLGRARNRVYELVTTDPIPWRIINAYVDADEGTA